MKKVLLVSPHLGHRLTYVMKHIEYIGDNLCGIVTLTDPAVQIKNSISSIQIGKKNITWTERLIRRFKGYPKNPSVHLLLRFGKILKALKPDIVLFEFATTAIKYWTVCVKHSVSYVIHFHGFDVALAYSDPAYKAKLLAATINSKENIANSNSTRERLSQIGISNIVLKYLGINIPAQLPTISTSNTRLRIIHLGSFFDVKNPLGTIKAFEWSQNSGLSAELIMVGDGELKQLCIDYVKLNSLHNITILASMDNTKVLNLMQSCQIFTQHSVLTKEGAQEGFGVAIIEAMSCGMPVVVSSSGALSELVIHQKTGILFPEHDWKSQGEAFLELEANRDLLIKYGSAGFTRAKTVFSSDRESAELRKILCI